MTWIVAVAPPEHGAVCSSASFLKMPFTSDLSFLQMPFTSSKNNPKAHSSSMNTPSFPLQGNNIPPSYQNSAKIILETHNFILESSSLSYLFHAPLLEPTEQILGCDHSMFWVAAEPFLGSGQRQSLSLFFFSTTIYLFLTPLITTCGFFYCDFPSVLHVRRGALVVYTREGVPRNHFPLGLFMSSQPHLHVGSPARAPCTLYLVTPLDTSSPSSTIRRMTHPLR